MGLYYDLNIPIEMGICAIPGFNETALREWVMSQGSGTNSFAGVASTSLLWVGWDILPFLRCGVAWKSSSTWRRTTRFMRKKPSC